MKRKIVAIGGGRIITPSINKVQTLAIDKEIISLANKKYPKVLFIPTASEDNQEYREAFQRLYSEHLDCTVDSLLLYISRPSIKDIQRKIREADIIYVGGGNTLRMMKLWRRLGIDRLLDKARCRGTVLSGLSAGAICWFQYGNSDSKKFKNPDDKTLIRVRGLGFADLLLCPHYDTEKHRQQSLKDMMQKHSGVAVALENGSALEIIDQQYRVITSQNRKNAWKIYWHKDTFYKLKLEKNKALRPLHELLAHDG